MTIYINRPYCVYLTVYHGNKLPMYYIGSSSILRIENGYRGSITSRRYKNIWQQELKEHPELFKIYIIKPFTERKEATAYENYLQNYFKVIISSMYVNQAVASLNGFHGMDVSGKNNPNYGKRGELSSRYGKKQSKETCLKRTGPKNPSYGKKGVLSPAYGKKYPGKCAGEKNPSFGKVGVLSPNYGSKRTIETRKLQSISLTKYSKSRPQAHNDNISKSLKGNPKLSERMRGENNPMYGKPCTEYNKQMTKLKNSGDNNPMRQAKYQIKCEHCGITIAKNTYTLFHGSKCKQKPKDV